MTSIDVSHLVFSPLLLQNCNYRWSITDQRVVHALFSRGYSLREPSDKEWAGGYLGTADSTGIYRFGEEIAAIEGRAKKGTRAPAWFSDFGEVCIELNLAWSLVVQLSVTELRGKS